MCLGFRVWGLGCLGFRVCLGPFMVKGRRALWGLGVGGLGRSIIGAIIMRTRFRVQRKTLVTSPNPHTHTHTLSLSLYIYIDMHMYMYITVCIYTYIHTYIHTYIP